MNVEEFSLRIGISKETMIILLIQAALIALSLTLGIGIAGEKDGKVPWR